MSARTILKHVYKNGGMTQYQYERIDRVLKERERPHGEWIPCSERLPEKNGRYLASWVSNLTNKYNIDSIFFAYGEWDCCNGDVEAWMPLPEPYEGSH